MSHKVLIADDSLTIQKVIRITLSGEPYQILDSDSVTGLYDVLEAEKPSLVFLDFGLDESVSGYEVCKKIIGMSPETKIMLMFGTFDNVDYDLLKKSGAKAHIVKPFDGQKFITLCHQLLEEQEFFGIESDEQSLDAVERELENITLELKKPTLDNVQGDLDKKEEELGLSHEDETGEWEMDVDPISIDDEIPLEVLEENEETASSLDTLEELEVELPEKDFLSEEDVLEVKEMFFDDSNDWGMSIPDIIEEVESDEAKFLDDEVIQEKIGEVKPLIESSFNEEGDLEANELIDFSSPENKNFSETVKPEISPQTSQREENSELLEEDIVAKMVREYMNENGTKIVERVAWEIIPEISESIIRKEVKGIVEKVLKDKA